MSAFLLWLFTSGPALIYLSFAVVNLRALRPLAPGSQAKGPGPRVSALVPARDEAGAIGACLDALAAEPFDEILVLDDQSRDATAAIVLERAARDPRVRLLRSPGTLPAGWAGKPRACAELTKAATGDLLVFVDADVRLESGGLAGLLAARAGAQADVVCALPRQELGTFGERLIVPLLHLVYFALAPLWLIPKVRSPIFTAANGQLMLATAEGVRRFGGHAHPRVRGAVVDDQAFCRTAKEHGLRLLFADGQRLSRCRMYRTLAEVRQGFAKNLYLGIGGTPLRLAFVLFFLHWGLTAPLLLVLAGGCGFWSAHLAPLRPLFWAVLPGALAVPLLRTLLSRRFSQPVWGAVLLHPLAVCALSFIAVESAVRTHRGGISWRGRSYGLGAGVIPEAQP